MKLLNKMNIRALLITCFVLLQMTVISQITGKVVSIHDGDTFTLLDGSNTQIKVRLHGIDCPELHQAYGSKAKDYTSGLIFGKQVTLKTNGKDRYGRTIAIVLLQDGRVLNELLLKDGYAWHYLKYDNNLLWSDYEASARSNKRGLWQDSNPVAPWDYRHK